MSCTPELKRAELRLGFVTSIFVGIVYAGTIATASYTGLNQKIAIPVVTFVMNMLGYGTDILIAKRCFNDWDDPSSVSILHFSREDFAERWRWFLRSFVSMMFIRNIVLSLLDALLVAKLSELTTTKLDEVDFMTDQKRVRNILVPLFVSLVTFNLFVNALRFAWVYQIDPDIGLTTLIMFWLVFVIFMS